MGILDVFKRKKDDDLAMQPEFGAPSWQDPMQNSQQYPPMDQQQMNQPYGQDNFQQNPFQQQPYQEPQPQSYTPEQAGFERIRDRGDSFQGKNSQSVAEINMGKDMEIISAKLDAIKAELDSINQRVKRIERMSEGTANTKRDAWY